MFLKGYRINSNIFNIGTRFSHLFKTAESVQWYDCIFFVSDSQIQSTLYFIYTEKCLAQLSTKYSIHLWPTIVPKDRKLWHARVPFRKQVKNDSLLNRPIQTKNIGGSRGGGVVKLSLVFFLQKNLTSSSICLDKLQSMRLLISVQFYFIRLA